MVKLTPPLSYQGGKTRLAGKIVDHLFKGIDTHYYDLCSGGGSVSIELYNRGVPPSNITMVELGPIGYFWKAVGDGSFDLDRFSKGIGNIPKDPDMIRDYLKEISKETVLSMEDSVYTYLLLQAGSFGGKQIWVEGDRFKHHSFRSYWQPTLTSSRRSPVNPMMPMPKTLEKKVIEVSKKMAGLNVVTEDVGAYSPEDFKNTVAYFDPPYEGTTGYGYNMSIDAVVERWSHSGIWVSEYRTLSDVNYTLSSTTKGGISGNAKKNNTEMLSYIKNNSTQ